jgi:hypothetical protein
MTALAQLLQTLDQFVVVGLEGGPLLSHIYL